MSDGFASIRSIKAGRVTEGVSFFQPDDKFDPCVVGLCGLKEVAFCRDKIEMTLFRLGL